jgi:signal transduction histidine kinase
MQKRFTNSFVRREDFAASGESAVRPYELELSLFFVIVLSGVYIAYDILAIPDGGHPFGHSLGIVGTLLMVMTETLYSLRKRTSWLNWAGPVRYWLSLHIVTGIVGPFMVLMHTGLQFRGLAGVSFFLTLVVVGSGFVGRYLYTALPRTITGVTTSKQALEREITAVSQQITQFEAQKPERVQQLVAELSQRPTERNPLLSILGRSYYQWRFQRRLKRELKKMGQLAAEQKQQLSQMLTRRRDLQRQTEMLEAARRVMRVWHILHIPFGLTLFFSVAIHVVATVYFRAGLFK